MGPSCPSLQNLRRQGFGKRLKPGGLGAVRGLVSEAERLKEASVIAAAAEAEENLIKDIKAAEAAEKAASHRAQEQVTLAEAELEASDRQARAKIRIAEGVQAEEAATGLAGVSCQGGTGQGGGVQGGRRRPGEAAGCRRSSCGRRFRAREHRL